MWSFTSKAIAGTIGLKNDRLNPSKAPSECSDDDISVNNSGAEGLECTICWESFNIVENVPYVLLCGHTLCKNCVLGLQWAVVKFPTLPIQLPFFISCPWCNLLSFRFVYKGTLKFPRKNFFLLWMVESMNGDRMQSHTSFCGDHQPICSSNSSLVMGNQVRCVNHSRVRLPEPFESNHDEGVLVGGYLNAERLHLFLRKSLVFFVNLTAKFPLVIIFLLIVLYAIPASAAILALYILITILFAVPSFLVLYFAYPSLDWLKSIAKKVQMEEDLQTDEREDNLLKFPSSISFQLILMAEETLTLVAEETLDVPVTPENIEFKGGHLRRNSTGNLDIPDNGVNVLPHYLRASVGSCHDFCKYGMKHICQTKSRIPMPKRITVTPFEGQDLARTEDFVQKNRTSVISPKSKSLPDSKSQIPDQDAKSSRKKFLHQPRNW
ncbi:hypothetical protein F0562_024861 [Nyssa sinensis]|uniref:RING-type domain-containing protein n=1 Tax=Nyssa sinensis TaxID=561372 RepID=A0A5J5BIQ6_9ASTE|nr:hypothetical protein F0562_024861 [Nyssa sinensis]